MKELFIQAHEELIEAMLERTGCSWDEAYDRCADSAYSRMQDNLADRADTIRQQKKDENQ